MELWSRRSAESEGTGLDWTGLLVCRASLKSKKNGVINYDRDFFFCRKCLVEHLQAVGV